MSDYYFVAPLAGAWIEINVAVISSMDNLVAPLAGAWIEISLLEPFGTFVPRRTPRGCVD